MVGLHHHGYHGLLHDGRIGRDGQFDTNKWSIHPLLRSIRGPRPRFRNWTELLV
jgi:hypothetical protein